jgi:hypothetical protein
MSMQLSLGFGNEVGLGSRLIHNMCHDVDMHSIHSCWINSLTYKY